MVVLADEILESFFDTDLSASFHLESTPSLVAIQQAQTGGFFGGLVSTIMSNDDSKRIFNSVADQIGKTMGKHQVRIFASFHEQLIETKLRRSPPAPLSASSIEGLVFKSQKLVNPSLLLPCDNGLNRAHLETRQLLQLVLS